MQLPARNLAALFARAPQLHRTAPALDPASWFGWQGPLQAVHMCGGLCRGTLRAAKSPGPLRTFKMCPFAGDQAQVCSSWGSGRLRMGLHSEASSSSAWLRSSKAGK